jgi:hypothetical protein
MNELEKLRSDLKPFNLAVLSKKAGVSYTTLVMYRKGSNKTIPADAYIKVRAELNKIAKDILGINHD